MKAISKISEKPLLIQINSNYPIVVIRTKDTKRLWHGLHLSDCLQYAEKPNAINQGAE